jgi:hypothetical protein
LSYCIASIAFHQFNNEISLVYTQALIDLQMGGCEKIKFCRKNFTSLSILSSENANGFASFNVK